MPPQSEEDIESELTEDAEDQVRMLLSPSPDNRVVVGGFDGDQSSVALLLLLYTLQGIPLGLTEAVPFMLTSKKISYQQQAQFSLVSWPFSLKLLWAPLVDSCYHVHFGRRKTWLVPVQYLIGLSMLALALNLDHLLQQESGPNVSALTGIFFVLNLLAATQDIAVDGWALTLLKTHNLGYASTCNAVGQTTGFFLGYVLFLSLDSYQLLSARAFLHLCGFVYIVSTTLMAFFKREASTQQSRPLPPQDVAGVMATYRQLLNLTQLSHMPLTMWLLLTSKMAFAATDAATGLKLVEYGVPKETLALMEVPLMGLQLLVPVFIGRYTSGPRPLNVFLVSYPARLATGAGLCLTVFLCSARVLGPFYLNSILFTALALHRVTQYSMFVSTMAFFAKISDPALGGTYMTFLNTLANLGGLWPSTLALWCIDLASVRRCKEAHLPEPCLTTLDGYYVESIVCSVIGLSWLCCS